MIGEFKPKETVNVTQQFLRESNGPRDNESYQRKSSSEQEHKVNALASGADERRDKLR